MIAGESIYGDGVVGALLAAAGVLFALLLVGNTALQTIRRRERVGFVHTLLAFLAALLPLAGLIAAALTGRFVRLAYALSLGAAGLLALVGLIVLAVEARRSNGLKNSRGALALGVGLLLAAATVTVPLTAERLLVTPTPFTLLGVTSPSPVYTPTPAQTATPMLTWTPTFTRTPRPTATPTRPLFATDTPTPTQAASSPCTAVVNYNLNLRAGPTTGAPVLASIPFNATLTLLGRSVDSTWWYAVYQGREGWVAGEFLTLDAGCAALPERP